MHPGVPWGHPLTTGDFPRSLPQDGRFFSALSLPCNLKATFWWGPRRESVRGCSLMRPLLSSVVMCSCHGVLVVVRTHNVPEQGSVWIGICLLWFASGWALLFWHRFSYIWWTEDNVDKRLCVQMHALSQTVYAPSHQSGLVSDLIMWSVWYWVKIGLIYKVNISVSVSLNEAISGKTTFFLAIATNTSSHCSKRPVFQVLLQLIRSIVFAL